MGSVAEIRQIKKMKVFEFVDRGTWHCCTVIIGAPNKASARKILRKWTTSDKNYKECKEIKSLTYDGKVPRVIREFNEGE